MALKCLGLVSDPADSDPSSLLDSMDEKSQKTRSRTTRDHKTATGATATEDLETNLLKSVSMSQHQRTEFSSWDHKKLKPIFCLSSKATGSTSKERFRDLMRMLTNWVIGLNAKKIDEENARNPDQLIQHEANVVIPEIIEVLRSRKCVPLDFERGDRMILQSVFIARDDPRLDPEYL